MKRHEHENGTTTYEHSDGTWTVADNQMWLPGIYATQAAALAAVNVPDDRLMRLSETRGVGTDYRPITLEELA